MIKFLSLNFLCLVPFLSLFGQEEEEEVQDYLSYQHDEDDDYLVYDYHDSGSLYHHSHSLNNYVTENPYDYGDDHIDDHTNQDRHSYVHTLDYEENQSKVSLLSKQEKQYKLDGFIEEEVGLDYASLPSRILDDHNSYYKAYSNYSQTSNNSTNSSNNDRLSKKVQHKHYFGEDKSSVERLHNNQEGWNDFE